MKVPTKMQQSCCKAQYHLLLCEGPAPKMSSLLPFIAAASFFLRFFSACTCEGTQALLLLTLGRCLQNIITSQLPLFSTLRHHYKDPLPALLEGLWTKSLQMQRCRLIRLQLI